MSTIRMPSRPLALLAVLAAGVPVIGALLSTPAAGFGLQFHGGGGAPMFARRQMTPSPPMPTNRRMMGLHQRQHAPSAATAATTTAITRAMRARSLASAGTTSTASKTKHNNNGLRGNVTRIATGDAQPGGPPTVATQTSSSTQVGSRMGTLGGSGPSAPGLMLPPSSGGSGQFTTAGAPANTGGTRSLNDPAANRSSSGGGSATNGQTTSNATTQNPNKANATAPSTRTTATLKAVTVCMTSAGSCPMDRDVGTACQCKDTQGNVYDGVVK